MDLYSQIEDIIDNNVRHRDYERVTELADKYKAFIVNEPDKDGNYPLNDYLKRFVRREDEELFKQRKILTKHYTPSICSQIIRMFNKVARSNRVIKLIESKDNKYEGEIDESLAKFYGEGENSGVDQYLKERFVPLTFTDPNAWFRIAFDEFDAKIEKPSPYPEEFSSKQVINFEIRNDKTKWVAVKLNYSYETKSGDISSSSRYLMFGADDALEYKEIPKNLKTAFEQEPEKIFKGKGGEYAVYSYNHDSKRVPLMRVGYRKDIETSSRTYVNPIHYEALPLLEQFVKVSSELQLSITLHTYPKQVTYVDRCDAKGCNNGVLADGGDCSTCQGTGKKFHTTSADILEVPMPKHIEDMVDISKISAYVPFPGNVMEFLDKYSENLEKKIIRMVFNSESVVQTQFNTATEAEIDVDSVYDTLSPFADKYSEVWMFFVKLSILYLTYEGVTAYHKFPSDFKLKPLSILLNELKVANDSNAPSYIRESINNDIADIIYADDQEERGKLGIKNKHFPFSGKTDFEIQNIILNNLTTNFKQVLYANFDSIFDELEIENSKFYDLAFQKQKELITAKVEEIRAEINPVSLQDALK